MQISSHLYRIALTSLLSHSPFYHGLQWNKNTVSFHAQMHTVYEGVLQTDLNNLVMAASYVKQQCPASWKRSYHSLLASSILKLQVFKKLVHVKILDHILTWNLKSSRIVNQDNKTRMKWSIPWRKPSEVPFGWKHLG